MQTLVHNRMSLSDSDGFPPNAFLEFPLLPETDPGKAPIKVIELSTPQVF